MILPWIKGFMSWHKAPVTWTLVLLNFFIFLQTKDLDSSGAGQDLYTVEMLILSGRIYDQFRQTEPLKQRSESEWGLLGAQALKDPYFVERAGTLNVSGDEIAVTDWKKKIKAYHNELKLKSSTVFGLRIQDSSPLDWVTYQFMHGGWMHLVSNMAMLLIFGAAVEVTIGSLGFAAIFFFSGFAGAGMFLLLGKSSLASVIGASGAVSGVMAFYAAYEKKRRVPFVYFLSPVPGFYGLIYLPTLMIFPLWFLSDLAGYLGTSEELGAGIAYTAHIGGALFGALLGFSLRYFRRSLWLRWISQH